MAPGHPELNVGDRREVEERAHFCLSVREACPSPLSTLTLGDNGGLTGSGAGIDYE